MNGYNKNAGTDIIMLDLIHIEPMAVYVSPKNKDITKANYLTKIKKGAIVGIPNDPSNEARALVILSQAGLIKMNEKANPVAYTPKDIASNPLTLKFKELEAAMLPRALSANSLDLAVVNANFAISAGLNPVKTSIAIESKDSFYANGIAVLPANKNDPRILKLIKDLKSPEVRAYIQSKYNGQVIPAF